MTRSRSPSPIAFVAALTAGAALAHLCGIVPERAQEALPAVVLTEILDDIRDAYVEELSEDELRQLAHAGFDRMLKELDRHSGYIPPARVQDFEEDTEGYFVGIGVVLAPPESEDRYPQIAAVVRGGPADVAGLTQGDRIQRVERLDVRGYQIPDLREKIRGEPRSSVLLEILRGDELLELAVMRRRVETSSVTTVRLYEAPVDPEPAATAPGAAPRTIAGYVRLDQFQRHSAEELHTAFERLRAGGAEAFILDLRDNTGGILQQATAVAGLFLPADSLVVTTRGRHNIDKPEHLRVEDDGPFQDEALIVLIDGGSASASELVSAALRDHGRALLVGDESFGKWSVQNIIALGAAGADGRLKLTTKGFFPPRSQIRANSKGHHLGLLPDVAVAIDSGTLYRLRRAWHEERLARVGAPLAVTRLPVPRYPDAIAAPRSGGAANPGDPGGAVDVSAGTSAAGEAPEPPLVDAVLVRALGILEDRTVFDELLAEAVSGGSPTGAPGEASESAVANGGAPDASEDRPR